MTVRSKKISLGADIELFVAKATYTKVMKDMNYVDDNLELTIKQISTQKLTGKEIIPCVGIFPGTKANPHTPEGWKKGYAVQEDNVMLEFNVPVSYDANQFIGTMQHARKLIKKLCQEKGLVPMWDLSEMKFKPIDLTSPQAKNFACDPDLDAYSGGIQRDSQPTPDLFRTAGGHIHIGGDFNCPDFVAILFLELVLALYMGSPFLINPDSKRARWYGRPGVYRTKPYGVEYRTMSNAWALTPYGLQDIAGLVFRVGNLLVGQSAQTLQQWFRRIEWTLLRELMMEKRPKAPKDRQDQNERWQTIRQQFQSLNIPGLQI